MSRKHSSAPAPRDERGKRITQVVINTDAAMPDTLKYPNGHLCDVPLDNVALMRQAADALGIAIESGAPRSTHRKRTQHLRGIFLQTTAEAPRLMDAYRTLLIAAFVAKQESAL